MAGIWDWVQYGLQVETGKQSGMTAVVWNQGVQVRIYEDVCSVFAGVGVGVNSFLM
ncbi:hypothetical protein [Flavihumibacter sp. ZG627]|uniref:hypothetical protein n=1 Tax=Flavihumibacter sp. ZG627 TaxID=1463156 RepID=UPI000A8AF41B|nr:hypothetical protein [Flavihumibacter sp. ZG627]